MTTLKRKSAAGSASALMSEGIIFVHDYMQTHIARFRNVTTKKRNELCGKVGARAV
jgi:hypothetical protein